MQVHVYDFRWADEDTISFEASLGNKFGKKFLKRGDVLSIEVKDTARCAGSSRDGAWMPCPDNIVGRAKCDTCRNREGSFIYTSFDGFNTDMFTPEDLMKIDGEHWVYFALFGENLQKVGVSKAGRKKLRQLEQGSTATLYIAKTPNGTIARQIETLFRKSGMLDKVQSKAKKNNWASDISMEQAQQILLDLVSNHKNCLQSHAHLNQFLLEAPEFVDWGHTFGTDQANIGSHDAHEVKLDVGESVSGEIIAHKGAFILLDTGEELVSICAKDLRGLEVEFEEKPAGLNLNTALQGALF